MVELSGEMEIFYSLIRIVGVYVLVKSHQSVHLNVRILLQINYILRKQTKRIFFFKKLPSLRLSLNTLFKTVPNTLFL